MKAILLAAGLGTRLRPLTDNIPKCLVPIADKPLLGWWLEQLQQAEFSEFIVNTHYMHKQVEEYIAQSDYAEQVTLVYEDNLLGTLGSIRNMQYLIGDDDCMIAHADNLCVVDWAAFIQRFNQRPTGCELTMMCFQTDTPVSCGMVRVDQYDVVCAYKEKPQDPWPSAWANAAVFLASNKAIGQMLNMRPDAIDLCKDFLPNQLGHMNVFYNKDILIDIGTPQSYARAQKTMEVRLKKGLQ